MSKNRIPLKQKLVPASERLKDAYWQIARESDGLDSANFNEALEAMDYATTKLIDAIDAIDNDFVLPRRDPWALTPGEELRVLPIHQAAYGTGLFVVEEYGLQCRCRRDDGVVFIIPRSYLASDHAKLVYETRFEKRSARNNDAKSKTNTDQSETSADPQQPRLLRVR